jgi:hypothetical protein
MNFDKLTAAIVGIVMLAAGTGQLPRLTLAVRKAQIQLIQETKALTWGQLPLLNTHTKTASRKRCNM